MRNGPYILVRAPNNYPGKKYREKYIYEHHLVWWKETGEVIDTSTHLLHHEDGDKHNNSFGNLTKKTREKHSAEHVPPAETIELKCDWCGETFIREARQHRSRTKNNYKHVFCSKSHQVKYQWKYQEQKKKILGG